MAKLKDIYVEWTFKNFFKNLCVLMFIPVEDFKAVS